MEFVNYFLLGCGLVLPVVTVIRLCRKDDGIEIDNIFLFSCGFIFYFILPIVLGRMGYFPMYSGYGAWKSTFDSISDSTWIAYFISCIVWYISFIVGDIFGRKFRKNVSMAPHYSDVRVLNVFLVVGIITAIFLGAPLRQYFFGGYGQSTQFPALGSFTAAAILLLRLAFLYSAQVYEERSLHFWKTILNRFFF